MKPTKDKVYLIDYHGFHAYDSYQGKARCNGEPDIFGFVPFEILEPKEFFVKNQARFPEKSIISEI